MRVLIANDDNLQIFALENIFKTFKFKITTAINGQQAFEQVQVTKNDLRKQFDLIVLDLNMPICDGYDACLNILKTYNSIQSPNCKQRRPYLVAVSAFVDQETRKKCKQFGFDDVMEMPLSCRAI